MLMSFDPSQTTIRETKLHLHCKRSKLNRSHEDMLSENQSDVGGFLNADTGRVLVAAIQPHVQSF